MYDTDEISLAAAAKLIIRGIDWRKHQDIDRIEATYEDKMLGGETVLVPKIVIQMKKECCKT